MQRALAAGGHDHGGGMGGMDFQGQAPRFSKPAMRGFILCVREKQRSNEPVCELPYARPGLVA
jgi:hypothetical protein